MSRRIPNRARDASVYLPYAKQVGPAVRAAQDLSDGQLWMLYELALRHGGHPADRCYTLWGFHPTEDERDAIQRRCEQKLGEWAPWVELIRREKEGVRT